ncbi:MAG: hypothetical protein K0R38_2310, partial [Polyangiaceae bacterium]|nr:hypothetical protein [Polyangiaceae bacterium]
DAQVVVRGRVMTLVVNDQADLAASHHLRQALLVKRADGAHQYLGVTRASLGAALDGDDLLAPERLLQLLSRLKEKLLTVREDQHLALRELREPRKDDRLPRAGRQAHEQPLRAAPSRSEDGLDGLSLVRA